MKIGKPVTPLQDKPIIPANEIASTWLDRARTGTAMEQKRDDGMVTLNSFREKPLQDKLHSYIAKPGMVRKIAGLKCPPPLRDRFNQGGPCKARRNLVRPVEEIVKLNQEIVRRWNHIEEKQHCAYGTSGKKIKISVPDC